MRSLANYWAESFDWRSAEADINCFDQYIADVDGLDVHFIHQRSSNAEAWPLIMVHGWPGSIVEFLDVIPWLTEPQRFGGNKEDAFHVVCPSLPGYGFSSAARVPGKGPKSVAAQHAKLMAMLGYEKFVAQGGDWGAITCRYLPEICADRILGLHLNLAMPRPPNDDECPEALLSAAEGKWLAAWAANEWDLMGYAHQQGTRPQTLAYGLSDSPVGLAGWITEKFHNWTDCATDLREAISWNRLLANISLYWFTHSIASSIRLYREHFDALRAGDQPAWPCRVPTGIANYPREVWRQPRAWAEQEYHLVHWYDAPRGGHFAAMEQPELFARDLQKFLGVLRQLGRKPPLKSNSI